MFNFFKKKKEAEIDILQTSVEASASRICRELNYRNFPEIDEILQKVIKVKLPRKHLKYRAGQLRY